MKTHVIDSFPVEAYLSAATSERLQRFYETSPITIWDEIPRAVWPMPQVIGEAEMAVRRQVAENMGMEFVQPSATALEEYAKLDPWYNLDLSWAEERILAHHSKEKMKRDAFAAAYGMSPEKIKNTRVRHVGTVRNHGRFEFDGAVTGRFSAGQP